MASLHKWPERAVSRLGGKQTLSRHGPEAMAQPFPEHLPGALLWSLCYPWRTAPTGPCVGWLWDSPCTLGSWCHCYKLPVPTKERPSLDIK